MRNLLEMCDVTLEDLREIYRQERSVKRVADKLGVSRPTATKWLRVAQVKVLGHRPAIKPTTSMEGEFGAVAKWIKEHPGEKLPWNAAEAAEIVGCSKSAVWNYFYRRKKRILRYINTFGDLTKTKLVLETTDGRSVSMSLVSSYKINFKRKGYTIYVTLKIRDTFFECKYPLKKFLTLLRSTIRV